MPAVADQTGADAPQRAPIDIAWSVVPVAIAFVAALFSHLGTIDLAYHVRAGNEMVASGSIIRSDSWTFTVPGTAWLDQQWGAQLILSRIHAAGGWPTMLVAWAVLSAITLAFVELACRARGASPRASALLAVGAYVIARPALAMRPQMLALPFFAAGVWAVMSRKQHPGRLWLLPAFAAVVANLHGSFILFPTLAGLALVEDALQRDGSWRRSAIVLVAATAATLLNPFGIGVWRYAVDLSTNPTIRRSVTEWAPLSLAGAIGFIVFPSMLLVAGLLARRRVAVPWIDLLWLGLFVVLALAALRGIVWWAVVAPVIVAGLLPPQKERETRGSVLPAFGLVATLIVVAIVALPWWRSPSDDSLLFDAPPGITTAVQALPAGTRLLTAQTWGSWLEFAAPDKPVFVDSRIEILPAPLWEDYSQVGFSGAGWREVLDRWDVQAIAAKADWDLLPYLRTDPGWQEIYEDDDGSVFVRH